MVYFLNLCKAKLLIQIYGHKEMQAININFEFMLTHRNLLYCVTGWRRRRVVIKMVLMFSCSDVQLS